MAYTDLSLAALRVRLAAKRDAILQWTPEEERRAINEALRFWNLLTGRWRRRAVQNTGNGTVEYALPSTLVYGMRVTVSSRPLVCTSLTELDLLLNFVLHLLAFKTGGPVWQATLPFYRAFLLAAAQENGILKSNQAFRRAAGLNRRGQLQPSKGAATDLDAVVAGAQG